MIGRLAATVALLFVAIAQTKACETAILGPDVATLADPRAGVTVAWRFQSAKPKVGEFFVLEFSVCDRAGPVTADTIRLDAIMPLHRHGMNFQPSIHDTGPDTFRAEGLMFHMPGTWQLIFERRSASGTVRLTSDVDIQ